jgi:hypothetical protein
MTDEQKVRSNFDAWWNKEGRFKADLEDPAQIENAFIGWQAAVAWMGGENDGELIGEFAECYISEDGLEQLRGKDGSTVAFRVKSASATVPLFGSPVAVPGNHDAPEIWVVLDETGVPIFCASWSEACHEHINDAINEHSITEAKAWKVRHYANGATASVRADADARDAITLMRFIFQHFGDVSMSHHLTDEVMRAARRIESIAEKLGVSMTDTKPIRWFDLLRVGTNSGHGHAWARPDGMKARCGGPSMCTECARDQALAAERGGE